MSSRAVPLEESSPVVLLQRGLQALSSGDWEALRGLCDDSIVWRIPGRSPLSGELVGPDAVVERFQVMVQATASDRPAEVVTLLEGPDAAAVVQRNHVVDPDGRSQPFTAVTLVKVRAGRIAEVEYFVSDQYAVDALWSQRL